MSFPMPAVRNRQILLTFAAATRPKAASKPKTLEEEEKEKFRGSLSAIELADDGTTAFLGGDETVEESPSVERLRWRTGSGFGSHITQRIDAFLPLPDPSLDEGRVGEIDIEGLSLEGESLWVIGSHSANRKQPKASKGEAENIARLADVQRGKNRRFLARISLRKGKDGGLALPTKAGAGIGAQLRGIGKAEDLLEALADDPHLGPFQQGYSRPQPNGPVFFLPAVPSKDNGFDIEGLAVRGTRVFVGLRGPVLRGWAVVLELNVEETGGKLKLRPFGAAEGPRYLKHFLDLGGLGVRDLCMDENDLLVLAGPTMSLDGPVAIYRWNGILGKPPTADTLTKAGGAELEKRLDLPFGEGTDHPEGMALLPRTGGGAREVLIVYDSPNPVRRVGDTAIWADVFTLP